LAALGLQPGVVTALASSSATVSATSSVKKAPYALGLQSSYDISTSTSAKTTATSLGLAASQLQVLYLNLTTPKPVSSSANSSKSSAVPAYLKNELANYNSGLQKFGAAPVKSAAASPGLSSTVLAASLLGASQPSAPSSNSFYSALIQAQGAIKR
jgi:hypothetical protein